MSKSVIHNHITPLHGLYSGQQVLSIPVQLGSLGEATSTESLITNQRKVKIEFRDSKQNTHHRAELFSVFARHLSKAKAKLQIKENYFKPRQHHKKSLLHRISRKKQQTAQPTYMQSPKCLSIKPLYPPVFTEIDTEWSDYDEDEQNNSSGVAPQDESPSTELPRPNKRITRIEPRHAKKWKPWPLFKRKQDLTTVLAISQSNTTNHNKSLTLNKNNPYKTTTYQPDRQKLFKIDEHAESLQQDVHFIPAGSALWYIENPLTESDKKTNEILAQWNALFHPLSSPIEGLAQLRQNMGALNNRADIGSKEPGLLSTQDQTNKAFLTGQPPFSK